MNKLAPLCCGRWGFCQTTPCVGLWLQGMLEVRGLYRTLAALLDVALDVPLKSSHVGRADSVTDWKGQVAQRRPGSLYLAHSEPVLRGLQPCHQVLKDRGQRQLP